MGKVNGVHHLAVCTGDLKAQLEFFTDVLGCELRALYWMHGADQTMHAFLRWNDRSSIAFVYTDTAPVLAPQVGVTHPKNLSTMTAGGTMQHLAMGVDTVADLLAMRDRIRSRGYNVIGPIDHGFCLSIYFGGPDQLALEISTSESAIDHEAWIDPAVVARAGISDEELQRMMAPSEYENSTGLPVANPPIDPALPRLPMRTAVWEELVSLDDAELTARLSESTPPVDVLLSNNKGDLPDGSIPTS
jgi:catechol 2,3-dioxygenase-like lactoylglutathione lyase family enzyme